MVLPADPVLGHPQQEVVARLWKWRQTETGRFYLVRMPSYRNGEDGSVAAEYRVWVVPLSMCGRSTPSTTTRSSPSGWNIAAVGGP
ncbi:hypothetical protein [Streptomyces sp. V1I1]|uniref:hypothetical protein n=1 Tax=Streptomyces sp. V1I1 TaxID=3042272 RepID=UPI0027D877E6|nr:hypothetical protein [Streptomyces sp. V1I1]